MELAGLADLTAKPHAPTAQNASFLVEQHPFTDVDALLSLTAWIASARKPAPEAHCIILQPALPGLVTDRAIQGMIQQQKFLDSAARQVNFGIIDVYHQTIPDRRVARNLQLRNPLELYLTEAAGAVDTELGMITVVGNIETGIE